MIQSLQRHCKREKMEIKKWRRSFKKGWRKWCLRKELNKSVSWNWEMLIQMMLMPRRWLKKRSKSQWLSKTTKGQWSKLLRCSATSQCFTLMSKLMVFQFKLLSTVVLKAQLSAKTVQQHAISCIYLTLDLQVWPSVWDSQEFLVVFTLLNSCWKPAIPLNVRSQY